MLTYIQGLNRNRDAVFFEEEITKFNQALIRQLETPGLVSISNKLGGPINVNTIQDIIKFLREQIANRNKSMNRWHGLGTFLFWVCHISLIAGFVLLLLSKIFS